MKDKSRILQERINSVTIDPSERVWNRLEQRLDQDKGKVTSTTIKYWGTVAAAILFLIASFSILFFSSYEDRQLAQIDLQPLPTASFASYQDAGKVNEIYSQHEWRQIEEGTKKRLKVNHAISSQAIEN